METNSRADLTKRVQTDLGKAERRIARLRQTSTVLMTVTIVTGGLSAVLAGSAAMGGTALMGSGAGSWRMVCGIASVLTLAGTIATGMNQSFKLPETLGSALMCAGQLRALDTALSLTDTPLPELVTRYEGILKEHQAVLL